MSKLLEKILFKFLLLLLLFILFIKSFYLENGNWPNDSQHGFRDKRSTMTALLLFTEHIRHSLNKGHITGAIFIDFRKAYETVNHLILLNKLVSFQLSSVISTLSSYLTNRSQVVKIGHATSDPLECNMGVPKAVYLVLYFSCCI